MFQSKKISITVLSITLGTLLYSPLFSYAKDTYESKKTTTVEQTTTSTSTKPATSTPVKKAAPVKPVTTTTSTTTTSTTNEGDVRKVLDEKALKKMSDSLCVKGFKAYVGNDEKNICQSKAEVPDIAYSCVWKDEGNAAYAATAQGPCALDYSEHKGSLMVTKNDYKSYPPLPYGSEAQCCFRAAKGPKTVDVQVSPTTTTVTPTTK